MRLTKYGCCSIAVLLVLGGCGAQGSQDDEMLGSGGKAEFSNPAGQSGQQPVAGSTQAGSGGSTKPAAQASGGAQAQAGKGGASTAGSGGKGGSGGVTGTAGAGTAGTGTAGTDTAGMGAGSGGAAGDDDPFAGLLPAEDPADMNAAPPAAGECADAVCFDVFDCYLWHADITDCGFTDCVDFVCQ